MITMIGAAGVGAVAGYIAHFALLRYPDSVLTPRNVIVIVSGISGGMIIGLVIAVITNHYGLVPPDVSGSHGIGVFAGFFYYHLDNRRRKPTD